MEYLGLPECRLGNTKDIFKDITHSDDTERLLQEYEAVFSKEKEAFYLSFRIRNSKGEYVPCICKGNVIFDEDEKPGIFTGAITVHKGEEEYDAITDLPKIQSFLLHISQIKKINKECLLMALILNISIILIPCMDMILVIKLCMKWQR